MKLALQVCSLELAKKLKELNVKQESHFYWVESIPTMSMEDRGQNPQRPHLVDKNTARRILSRYKRLFSAFTVAELLELFPKQFKAKIRITNHKGFWYVDVDDIQNGPRTPIIGEPELQSSLAKMLIYLLEQKLITL